MVLHPADPSEEGGHAPEAGAEAPDKDRLAAVLLEVAFDLAQALGVEQEGEDARLQDAVQDGPSSVAPDPVHRVVRDGGAQHAREHHQRQGHVPAVGEETPGEHHDISRGRQAEVIQSCPQEDNQVTVGEEQVRDEIEQTLGRVRHRSDEVQDTVHKRDAFIPRPKRQNSREPGDAACLEGARCVVPPPFTGSPGFARKDVTNYRAGEGLRFYRRRCP